MAKTTKGVKPMKILDQTHEQFSDAFYRRYGKGTYLSTAVYRHVMKTGDTAFHKLEAFSQFPELAGQLETDLELLPGRLVKRRSDAGVVKFVTRLADDLDIESVVIPMFMRHTLCVSSQVGCRMGCRFCETGKMGLSRNLTTEEIVAQVFAARHRLSFDVRNVVFMGMGEPLDNMDNVVQAIRVIEDQRGLNIARRYITISTVGLTIGIDRLSRISGRPLNLAVSLNAPDDEIRSTIMPINRSNSMAALKAALLRYPLAKRSSFFIEYVLIQGINDQQAHAKTLARYLSPLKVKLNLIPFNPSPGSDFHPPSTENYERFHAWLLKEKVFVRRRREKGSGILAACGQLGGNQDGH